MNKQGIILISSLLVVFFLSLLLVAFYSQSISENQLANKYADSTRALWLAEAGIAKVKSTLGITAPQDLSFGGNPRYQYRVDSPTLVAGTTDHYNIVSTGTVISPLGWSVSRKVNVTMRLVPPSASQFQYSVETTSSDLDYKTKNIENPENPANLAKTSSTQVFSNLFGISKAEMKAVSQEQGTYLSGSFGNTINASGVTWVDVDEDTQLDIQHLIGSGIVVINGDFRLNGVPGGGGSTFDGILYVVGQFEMLGNANVYGSVFVESSATIGADLTGSSLVSYNSTNITSALLGVASKSIASWREI